MTDLPLRDEPRVRPAVDWSVRAESEAAAIFDEVVGEPDVKPTWALTRKLMAIAWIQGMNLGSHETLTHVEEAFMRMRSTA